MLKCENPPSTNSTKSGAHLNFSKTSTPLADPPPQRMATAVDGTHPTGMLSCQFTSLLPSLEPPSSRDPTLVYSGFSQMHKIGNIGIN